MKIYRTPQKVVREICVKHSRQYWTAEKIAQWLIDTGRYTGKGKFDSVASLVSKIIYRNRASCKIDREYEESEQIIRVRRRIEEASETRKDVHDWETLLDSKITPKKVEHSGIPGGETKIIIVRNGDDAHAKANGDSRSQTQTVPGRVSFLRPEVSAP